jgi:hypothetical protein
MTSNGPTAYPQARTAGRLSRHPVPPSGVQLTRPLQPANLATQRCSRLDSLRIATAISQPGDTAENVGTVA